MSAKRILAFLLSLAMLLSTVTPTFADEGTDSDPVEGNTGTVVSETAEPSEEEDLPSETVETKTEEQNEQDLPGDSEEDVSNTEAVPPSVGTDTDEPSDVSGETDVHENTESDTTEEPVQNDLTEGTEDPSQNSVNEPEESEETKTFNVEFKITPANINADIAVYEAHAFTEDDEFVYEIDGDELNYKNGLEPGNYHYIITAEKYEKQEKDFSVSDVDVEIIIILVETETAGEPEDSDSTVNNGDDPVICDGNGSIITTDPTEEGGDDPIVTTGPNGEGGGDSVVTTDPNGEGGDDPIVTTDPNGEGVDDPVVTTGPNEGEQSEAKVTLSKDYGDLKVTIENAPVGTELTVKGASGYEEALAEKMEAYSVLFGVDIGLNTELEEDVKVTLEGEVFAELDPEAVLYHVNKDNKADKISYTYNEKDNTIEFYAKEFSLYLLVKAETVENNGPGDSFTNSEEVLNGNSTEDGTGITDGIGTGDDVGTFDENGEETLNNVENPNTEDELSIDNQIFNNSEDLIRDTNEQKCGDDLYWSYDATSATLTIIGSGAMYNYSNNTNYSPWYSNRNTIRTVALPEGITTIGNRAFYNCTSITSMDIPNNVTHIGQGAFENCRALSTVSLGENVTMIDGAAFGHCGSLTTISIPNRVITIGDSAFYDSGITSITIPDSVEYIGSRICSGCGSLTQVNIGSGVTEIGDQPFMGCGVLNAIIVDQNNASYQSIDGVLFSADGKTVYCFPQGKISDFYSLPYGVTEIAPYAFRECSGITLLSFPDTLTLISDYAFLACTGLTAASFPNTVTSIGECAFASCSGLESVYIPNGVISIGENAFANCSLLPSIIIPNSVTSIGPGAFKKCESLNLAVLSTSLSYIPNSLFNGCSQLVHVDIPVGVNSIGESAFEQCSGMTSITIPDSVTEIGVYAFKGCRGITTLTLPNSIGDNIGKQAFAYCSGLISIALPEGITRIGEGWFSNCSGLRTINIPNGVTSIDSYAFSQCTSLENISIPGSVAGFGEGAFSGCSNLASVDIEEGVTRIGGFSDCSSLRTITIPNSVELIDNDAFSRSGIESITISNGVRSIGHRAFQSCINLTTIIIPESVTVIWAGAFMDCSNLSSIIFLGNRPSTTTQIVPPYYTPPFQNVTANAYFSIHKSGWDTHDSFSQHDFGGNLTWYPYGAADAMSLQLNNDEVGFFVMNYMTYEPLSGVTVELGDQCVLTNEKGVAIFSSFMEGEQEVVFHSPLYAEKTIKADIKGGSYYTYTLVPFGYILSAIVSDTPIEENDGATESSEENSYIKGVDILKEKYFLTEGSEDSFHLKVTIAGGQEQFKEIWIVQDGEKKKTSQNGVFDNLKATDFSVASSIYFIVIGKDEKRSAAIKTNLWVRDNTFLNDSTPKMKLGEKIEFTLPLDWPVIGGGKLEIDFLEDLPVYVEVEGDKIRIAVNAFKKNDDFSNLMHSSYPLVDWELLKESLVTESIEKAKKAYEQYEIFKMGDLPSISVNKTKLKFDVWGIFEGNVKTGEINGEIKVKLSEKITHEHQTFLMSVPFVVTVGFEGKCDASATFTGSLNDILMTGSIKPSIAVSLGAGPGIVGVGSLTVNGKGTIGAELIYNEEVGTSTRAYASLEAYMKLKLLMFEFENTWAKQIWELPNNQFSKESGRTSNLMDLSQYSLRSRADVDTSTLEWKGEAKLETAGVQDESEIRSFGEGRDSETPILRDDPSVLQQSSYSDSCLNVVECGGKRVMFLLMDDQNRPVGNGTKLCYSVFDADAGWSEPLAVEDNETADFSPKVFSANGKAYVVWIDVNDSIEGINMTDYATVVSKLEIKLAEFEPQSNRFTVTRLTNDSYYDTLPQVKVHGNTVYVIWLKNMNNNLLMNDESNSIWYYRSDTGVTIRLADNLENITEINATVKNNTLCVAYISDVDGDYMTTNDRTLISLSEDGTATTLAENKTVAELSSHGNELLWYEDGTLTASNEGEENSTFCGLDKPVFGKYQVLETSDKTYIVFPGNVYSDDGESLYTELFAYIFDKDSENWGDAVQLTSLRKTIIDFKAFVDEQSKIQLVVTASTLTLNEEAVIEESTSLHNLTVLPHVDLELGELTYDDVTWDSTEYTLEFTAILYNNGTIDTDNPITLTLYDENNLAIATLPVECSVLAGGIKTIEGTFVIPTIKGANSLFIVKTETEGDSKESNNTKLITVAKEKITVSMDDYAMFNDYYVLSVAVKNEGLFAATPTLECRLDSDGGELLHTETYSLNAGEMTHAIIRINAKNIRFENEARNLYIKTNGDSINGFFFVLYAPHDHIWSEPTWTWNKDYDEAIATFECTVCMIEETIDASVQIETIVPTEEADGSITHTATVIGPDKETYTETYVEVISTQSVIRIEVTALPIKTIYEFGESFDSTGGRIIITYGNNATEEIDLTSDMVSGFDNTTVGTQTLTVTYEGKTATFDITIIEMIAQLNVTSLRLDLVTNKTFTLVLSTDGGTVIGCIWSSADSSVATVDANGLVTAVKPGLTTITATSTEGNNVKTCRVRVLFSDALTESAYYFVPVYWAADNGITTGYTSGAKFGKFGVGDACTREQAVTFLWRLMGSPMPTKTANFKDVAEGAYYYNAVSWAAEQGITTGYTSGANTGKFGVGDKCTREQLVTFLYRAVGSPAVTSYANFKDVQQGAYYYDAVSWAAEHGITTGYTDGSGRFGVKDNCKREQVVTFIYRYASTYSYLNAKNYTKDDV